MVSLNKGTTDIKRLFEQYEFEENIDFKLRNVAKFNSKGGKGNKNDYYLHPRSFKICLLRSLKTKKYAKYYLLLEECIKYYNNYQNKLQLIKLKNKINKKDIKICSLEDKKKINKILEDNKETKIMNEKLLEDNKEIIKVAKKLDIAVKDRVMKTKRLSTLEYFIIMKNSINEYKYYIIRGQKRYINKKIEKLEGYTEIKKLE